MTMTNITESSSKTKNNGIQKVRDLLIELDDKRTDALLIKCEIKEIMKLCTEHTGYEREQDDIEWHLIFRNVDRLVDMLDATLTRMDETLYKARRELDKAE